jgi:type I restriction enzyme S subunit
MRVKPATIKDYPFPLAPRDQQKRVVAEIEKQFSRLDEAVANLKRVKANLKRYKAAVLKAAVEGKLTEDWRKAHPDVEPASELLKRILAERRAKWEQAKLVKTRVAGKAHSDDKWKERYRELTESATMDPSGLPLSWTMATIGKVAECLDSMRVPVNKKERLKRNGNIPYFGANGQVGWIDDHIFDEPLVLVVEDETFVGRSNPFSYTIRGKTWVNNHAHVLRPTGTVDLNFLNYSLMHYPFTPLTTGTTGRRKLTQKALMLAPYRLPPLNEQKEIAFAVDSRISVVDEIGKGVDRTFERIEGLRQTILKKGFSGTLVPCCTLHVTETEHQRTTAG